MSGENAPAWLDAVETAAEGANGSEAGHGAPLPSKLVVKVDEGVAGAPGLL